MPVPFPLKDIAFQAGLSLATVDRVVHGRPGVRRTTRARVEAAIAELTRQYGEAGLAGRRLSIDVVMEAPRRFTDAVRAAFEAELPGMRPASFSARFHLAETMREGELAAILSAIGKRGSHGLLLKAPSTRATADLARGLTEKGVPVATYVTDIAADCRLAYIGMDNWVAGATAAYFLGQMLPPGPTGVLVTLSSASFAGEEEREAGFRGVLRERFPHLKVVTVSEGHGIDRSTRERVLQALAAEPDLSAVYSIGGANQAILAAFVEEKRPISVFVAHDLDEANSRLLAAGKLSFVIHHDFRQDARNACQIFLHHHRMLPEDFTIAPSRISIVTPYDPL
ncbi:LacI family DNA-binding transcriptional regulator [Jiella marina]|uniref:LacI family DNA-binding transcriptional regulator n=1 Tax=Jiella sp. LLJ827 TaxID=2917712 RepID=UPI00210156B7|nr:LacI family DNA-binding transcriptional regulator [Jiella sp. LLJ827]MCQ0987268.1 LacI family DNA-binding transcriptional regulator [Jiella sp. LLJ827]